VTDQVQRADGVWVPATPVPGTILVNTGDLLNFWSGGRYPATVSIKKLSFERKNERIYFYEFPRYIAF